MRAIQLNHDIQHTSNIDMQIVKEVGLNDHTKSWDLSSYTRTQSKRRKIGKISTSTLDLKTRKLSRVCGYQSQMILLKNVKPPNFLIYSNSKLTLLITIKATVYKEWLRLFEMLMIAIGKQFDLLISYLFSEIELTITKKSDLVQHNCKSVKANSIILLKINLNFSQINVL